MLKKAYLEITNVCNLSCSFCHGTKRPPRFMSVSEFEHAAKEIRPHCEYLYFHLMGEPLLHPHLVELFDISHKLGFKVIITTNGTLLQKNSELLLDAAALHKLSVSVHSFEANSKKEDIDIYLDSVFDFCAKLSERGKIAVMRLWNKGGEDSLNSYILDRMHDRFAGEWTDTYSGSKISPRLFLEWGERFDWPDSEAPVMDMNISCWGLRDQIGVLCDGTVVPCCLDADGKIPLGNIFSSSLSDILNSERARELKLSFERRCVSEELCLRCGYAHQKKY